MHGRHACHLIDKNKHVNNSAQLNIRTKSNRTAFSQYSMFHYSLCGKSLIINLCEASDTQCYTLIDLSSMNPTSTFFPSAQTEPVKPAGKISAIFSSHNHTSAEVYGLVYMQQLHIFEIWNNTQHCFTSTQLAGEPDTVAAIDAALCLIYFVPLSDLARLIPR